MTHLSLYTLKNKSGLIFGFAILIALNTIVGCNQTSGSRSNKMAGKPKKRVPQKEIPSWTDYNQIFENKKFEGVPIEILEIGNLNVPTGKIVVCDPLMTQKMIPFNKTVKPGNYPVKIYVAKTKESGDRYAIAKLEFSSKKADKWILALLDSDDTSKLKDSLDYFGFSVDAGLGSFCDYSTGLEYMKFQDQFDKKNPGGNIYDDLLAAEFKKNAKEPNNLNDYGDWINFKLPQTGLNITMFQSGYGDGSYPAYWGMTKDNEIVSLVIDFLVLLPPDK